MIRKTGQKSPGPFWCLADNRFSLQTLAFRGATGESLLALLKPFR